MHCVRCGGSGLWGACEADVCMRCQGSGQDPGREKARAEYQARMAAKAALRGVAAAPAAPAPKASPWESKEQRSRCVKAEARLRYKATTGNARPKVAELREWYAAQPTEVRRTIELAALARR